MILHIEIEKFVYKPAKVISLDSGNKVNIEFEDGEVIEVYSAKIQLRMSHIGIEGYVRKNMGADFKVETFDCYPTKPRSK
ncbi:MAG: hypothetical protein P8J32_01230 [bacterium]|nr:hypothetical protein [bacterium]